MINVFLKNIRAEAYHWTSDDEITKFVYKNNSELIQKLNFIPVDELKYVDTCYVNMFDYFCDPKHYDGNNVAKIIDETNNLINDHHLGEFGHKKQADYFFKYIKSEY